MELGDLQTLFYEALTTKKAQSTESLGQRMQAKGTLTFAQGLATYQDSVRGKLSRALEDIYPVCCRLVGDKFFAATAKVYIARFPSRSPNLGDYGDQFPRFLAQFEPVAALPYLPDMARLEWHWHRVFNSREQPKLDIQALASVSPAQWGELIFHLLPNSVLLESMYPVDRIWQVNQPDYDGTETVNLDQGDVKLFLWRHGYDLRIDRPNETEWHLLQAFKSGLKFAEICDRLGSHEPVIDVASLLPLWVQRGWITGFSLPSVAASCEGT